MVLDTAFMYETFFLVLGGVKTTLLLTFLSLLLAAGPAFYLAVVREGRHLWQGRAAVAYISFVRGTPIILQILLLYSLLPSLLHVLVRQLGLPVKVFEDIDPLWYAVAVFTFNTIALLSEIMRSALLSVPQGQKEAALATGLSETQAYFHVILPQALTVALPALCNLTVNLIKGTSLAFLMTVKDVMAVGKVAASFGYNYLEAYLDVFLVYILLCSIIQLAYGAAERKMSVFRG